MPQLPRLVLYVLALASAARADVRVVALGAREAVGAPGQETTVRCVVRNTGAEAIEGIEVRAGSEADPGVFVVGRLAPGEEREVLSPLRPHKAGFAFLWARVTDGDGNADERRCVLPVLPPDAHTDHEVRSGDIVLRFPHMAAGHGVIELIGADAEGEERLGVIPSLAALQLAGDPCPLPIYAILDPTDDGGVAGLWTGPTCTIAVDIRPAADGGFAIRCALTALEDLELRGLVCPEVHVGSGTGDGYTAAPPVEGTAALASDLAGWTVGLTWAGEASATLSSPNSVGGMGDHLLALGLPAGAADDEAPPLALPAGDTLELRCVLTIGHR